MNSPTTTPDEDDFLAGHREQTDAPHPLTVGALLGASAALFALTISAALAGEMLLGAALIGVSLAGMLATAGVAAAMKYAYVQGWIF